MRAIAVLEWTGELGKPKACRMVPMTVYDGEKLQDAGIYLARPAAAGLVRRSGIRAEGRTARLSACSTWKTPARSRAPGSATASGSHASAQAAKDTAPAKIDDEGTDDKPVLHRKKHSGDAPEPGKPPVVPAQQAQPPPANPTIRTGRSCTRKRRQTGSNSTATTARLPTTRTVPELEKKPETSEDRRSRLLIPTSPPCKSASAAGAGDIGNVIRSIPTIPTAPN